MIPLVPYEVWGSRDFLWGTRYAHLGRLCTDELRFHHACIGPGTLRPWEILAIRWILDCVSVERVLDRSKLDNPQNQFTLRSTCET